MSQSGLHAIFGTYAGHLIEPGAPEGEADGQPAIETARGAFKYGLVLGSILPDVDMFIMGPAYLFMGSDAVTVFHRSWSHSWIIQSLFAALLFAFWVRGNPGRRGLVKGLWLGMVLHSVFDIFMWFSGIHLLWPLGLLHVGVSGYVNLWASLQMPGWVGNILGAGDYLFFALFFGYLARIAVARGVNLDMVPRVLKIRIVLYALFVIFGVLSFVLSQQPGLYNIADYAFFIVVFLPVEIWVILRMKETMARA